MTATELILPLEDKAQYSFRLTDLRPTSDFDSKIMKLRQHADSILSLIEFLCKRRLYNDFDFVIGKSYARQKKRERFDPMIAKSWKLDGGVNGRWKEYKDKGFNGLIVLCAVTKEMLPRNMDDDQPLMNQQNVALALEQQLIQYYAFQQRDVRLQNQSLHPGNLERKHAKAGVVYLAYKFDKAEE